MSPQLNDIWGISLHCAIIRAHRIASILSVLWQEPQLPHKDSNNWAYQKRTTALFERLWLFDNFSSLQQTLPFNYTIHTIVVTLLYQQTTRRWKANVKKLARLCKDRDSSVTNLFMALFTKLHLQFIINWYLSRYLTTLQRLNLYARKKLVQLQRLVLLFYINQGWHCLNTEAKPCFANTCELLKTK